MNSKAQTLGIAIIVMITIFIIGMMFVNIIKPEVTRARETGDGLDCTNTADFPDGISDGTKLVCLTIDLVIPYFIVIVFSVAGGLIVSRFVI